jgi:transposase
MKPLTIPEAETIIMGLQAEIRRSNAARYDHRLHVVLLVAQGMNCAEVAKHFGDATRTVQYWVKQFIQRGLAGLAEAERSGRPPSLNETQLLAVDRALRDSPEVYGLGTHLWDGKTLSAFIKERFRIDLGVRQCQRLFRQLGFRLRKPRPLIAHADPEVQQHYKKTPGTYQKPRG